jgi:hypothetical protein
VFFFGVAMLVAGAFPATAKTVRVVGQYGCGGDAECVKIAEAAKCDAGCQRQCKELRFDAATCFSTYGPQFEFVRSQQQHKPAPK